MWQWEFIIGGSGVVKYIGQSKCNELELPNYLERTYIYYIYMYVYIYMYIYIYKPILYRYDHVARIHLGRLSMYADSCPEPARGPDG